MDRLKKLLIFEIFDFMSRTKLKTLKSIRNKRIFQYWLFANRENIKSNRVRRIKHLLLRKQVYENEKTALPCGLIPRPLIPGIPRMLIFRTGEVNPNYIPPQSFEYDQDLNFVRDLVRLNRDDIVGLRYSEKKINQALLPEIVYKTDSKIKILKEDLIKIFKQENKLRMAEITMSRNDYFSGLKLMSEIDQDHIEEALEFYGFDPQNDYSLKAYHLACNKYINDPEMKEKIVWMKYDKMRSMSVKINQEPIVEGITLYNLEGKPFLLKDLIIQGIPNLIVCGSYS